MTFNEKSINDYLNEIAESAVQKIQTGEVSVEDTLNQLVRHVWDKAIDKSINKVIFFEKFGDLTPSNQIVVRECSNLIKELSGYKPHSRYDEKL